MAVVVIGISFLFLLGAVIFFATRSELTRAEVRDLVEAAQTGKLCAEHDMRACDLLVARNRTIEDQTDHRLCLTSTCAERVAVLTLREQIRKHRDDLRGPRGRRGPEGRRGADGRRGPRGAVGPRGRDGIDGQRGPKGHQGSKGSRGHVGLTGKNGIDGVVPDIPDTPQLPDVCDRNGGCWKPRF